MTVPNGGDTPSRYQFNPVDDRAILGDPPHSPERLARSAVYLAVATAVDAITVQLKEGTGFVPEDAPRRIVDPQTKKALRSAESALRRAGFSLVIHA